MLAKNSSMLPTSHLSAIIVLLLVGNVSAAQGASPPERGGYNSLSLSRTIDGRSDLSDAGTPAFAYMDGYWDVRHQWHVWASDDELESFRSQANSHFHAWNHDRDGNFGWLKR